MPLQTFHQQNGPNFGGEIFSTIVWITHTLNRTKPANQSRQLANIITQISGTQLIFTFCDAIMSISLYSHVEICFILLISSEKNSLEKNGSYMKLFHRFVELLYVCKMVMSFLLVLWGPFNLFPLYFRKGKTSLHITSARVTLTHT